MFAPLPGRRCTYYYIRNIIYFYFFSLTIIMYIGITKDVNPYSDNNNNNLKSKRSTAKKLGRYKEDVFDVN